jgi:hypothetical protein
MIDADVAHVPDEIAGGHVGPARGFADGGDATDALIRFGAETGQEPAVDPDLLELAGVLEDDVYPFLFPGNTDGRDLVLLWLSRTIRRAAPYTIGRCRSASSRKASCDRSRTYSRSNSWSSINGIMNQFPPAGSDPC